MNGFPDYRSPSQSFFFTSSLGNILQNGSVLVDIPLVDQSFYGEAISKYMEELKTIGVMFEYGEACEFIGKRLKSLAASSHVTRENLFSILHFIRFLREKCLSPDSFIQSIKEGSWLKTSHGYRSPGASILHGEEWKIASQISDIPFIDQNYYGEELLSFKVELQLLGVLVEFNQNYQLVIDQLKLPSSLICLTAEAVHLVLACVRHSKSSDKLVNALGNTKCMKTDTGYMSPGECYLSDPKWACLLEVFHCFPLIDQNFYGSTIVCSKMELQQLVVVVEFEKAIKAFVCLFKQQASTSSISKDHVLKFLSCYRQLNGTSLRFPAEFTNCIGESNWLRTRLGDYRSPRDCILFGPDWKSISSITLLPFIDDSDRFYSMAIHEFQRELEGMGTVIVFEDGVKFIADGLFINPCKVTRANVISLLKCIRILQEKNCTFPRSFTENVSQKWLRTCGSEIYSSPKQCLLFDSMCQLNLLKQTDGPFIDESFYGSEIKSYRKELNAIGVTVDLEKGCPLLASHLDFHTDFATIVRIYNVLAELKWHPEGEAARRISIPEGSQSGQWVSPVECVLHDNDGLFSTQMKVLDKHYDRKLLSFFSSAFGVKSNPSVDDYCKFWKVWESSEHKLSNAECCAFWRCVLKHCSSKTQKLMADSLVKLPVNSGLNGILLFDKRDVFLADDLQLKDVIEKSSTHSLFVWYPQPSLPAIPQTMLLEFYEKIGVRAISDSVQKEELSLREGVGHKQVNQKDYCIGKGLLKLILGFLADPSVQMELAKRHDAVKWLMNLTILETAEPITLRYTLSLSSGEIVDVRVCQMIRWDRTSGQLFTQKIDRSGGHKNLFEYASQFAEIISKGVLWEREDHINSLSELIKLAFLVEFNEEAVGYLMKSKNMQIFMEDEEFLLAAFSSG